METAVGGQEAEWHTDGHRIELRLVKNEVLVSLQHCPEDGKCEVREVPCVVKYFVDTFGLECNVGSVYINSSVMEIAWALMGDSFDLGACQLWWIPTEDEAFASWLDTKTT